jgi:hypothetical protein
VLLKFGVCPQNSDGFAVRAIDDQVVADWPKKYGPVFGKIFAAMADVGILRKRPDTPFSRQ